MCVSGPLLSSLSLLSRRLDGSRGGRVCSVAPPLFPHSPRVFSPETRHDYYAYSETEYVKISHVIFPSVGNVVLPVYSNAKQFKDFLLIL